MTKEHKWKRSHITPIEDAVEELDRIEEKHGSLNAKDVVDESRPEDAVLHREFEWRDEVAAEQYRVSQARSLIRHVVVVHKSESEPEKEVSVRRYCSTYEGTSTYEHTVKVLSEQNGRARLLAAALRDMRAFRDKYATLDELSGVLEAADQVLALNFTKTAKQEGLNADE